jgi:hypothetical protein
LKLCRSTTKDVRGNFDFFDTLGVKVQMGRTFLPAEDRSDRRFEAILSHGLWVRRFGVDPGVLGRTVHLNDSSFIVVGVLPGRFSETHWR